MPADLAFLNGPIFTAESARGFVESVAVTGDRIVYAGSEAGLRALVGAETTVIDLRGRLAAPGFQDAHVHPGSSGIAMSRCLLADCSSAQEAVEAVARYAGANPDEDWVRGSGWSQDWFARGCPDKELLDAVVPDRPVYLPNRDGHSGWVNSRALELAGIGAGAPDPPDGRIERLADGSPQGTLHEGARHLVASVMPPDTFDEVRRGLLRAQDHLLSKGITSWQDAHVDGLTHRAYLSLARSDDLTGRVTGAIWWDRHRGEGQIEDIVELSRQGTQGYRPKVVKLMLDGVMENFTAALLEPYLDGSGNPTDNKGIDFIETGELQRIVTRLDALGLSCHFHAIGDGAVRHALDAVEAASRANGTTSSRHHIAHVQLVHPDDLPRFAALGVTANCQALWAVNEGYQTMLTQPFIGPERSRRQYPFGSLMRHGARLAMGSDWDVSTPDVFEQVDVAVNRTDHRHPDREPLNATEALGLGDALVGFTKGSAYVNHQEDRTGTLQAGRLADLVVLDRDPFKERRPAGTLVDMTVVGGRVVYER